MRCRGTPCWARSWMPGSARGSAIRGSASARSRSSRTAPSAPTRRPSALPTLDGRTTEGCSFTPIELRSILTTAHRAGFQTATHAIGDAAIRLVVETLEEVQDSAPRKSARHRIEHYELPDDDVLRRTKAAGIVASCQPNFVGQWSGPGDVYETRLGSGRFAANNPFRKIVRAHIPLCFGSD